VARSWWASRRVRVALASVAALALGAAVVLRLAPAPLLVNRSGMSQLVVADDGTPLRLSLASADHNRRWTPLEDVPDALVAATLLQEDRWFHWHPGVNPWALVRAAVETYGRGDRRVGASTITMQLARLRFGMETRTWHGKLRQIAQALLLELRHDKRELLEAYLNLAPYGGNVAGVGAASWVLFGKPVAQLMPAEALSLAVIPKSPAARSPFTAAGRAAIASARDALAARWRRDVGPLALQSVAFRSRADLPFRAPHLADRVLAAWPDAPRIATTIDPKLQELVESAVRSWLTGASRVGVRNAAVLVVEADTMAVRAYVGSADHGSVAIQGAVDGVRARRSPGSALKPFLYGLALDHGLIGPETMLEDTSLTISSWNPENFDRTFVGPVRATDALVRSRNLPAVQLANRLPGDGLYGFLRDAGIGGLRDRDFYGLALALGGVEVRLDELVRLYAMLANGGVDRPLLVAPSLERTPRAARRLLSPQASFLVLDMLRENPRPGDEIGAMHARRRTSVAWKTGTSFGFRDAWAAGVMGRFAIGVWAGNCDATPNPALVGRDTAGPLFFLRRAGARADPPRPPDGVVRTEVCALSGAPPGPHCPGRTQTWAIAGRSPIAPCSIHRDVAIDIATGLRACPGATTGVRHEVYEFWPSHLQALFRRVGIARRTPPPFAPGCDALPAAGRPLRIDSPQARVTYALRDGAGDAIAFSAVADADGRRVSWFVDDAFVGQSEPGGTLFWPARPGRFTLRAVDAMGRSVSQPLRVELVSDGRPPDRPRTP
jgi:penicillin-binding protein 1C